MNTTSIERLDTLIHPGHSFDAFEDLDDLELSEEDSSYWEEEGLLTPEWDHALESIGDFEQYEDFE